MVLNGALAYAKMCGDVLAGTASEYQVHDLMLSWSETCEMIDRGLPPVGVRA